MTTVQDGLPYRTAEASSSSEVQSELIRRDTTNDHPLKDVDPDEFEALAKYAMMPKGVALAAFSRPSIDRNAPLPDIKFESRNREDSTISLESLDLDLPPLDAYKVETVAFPKSPQELRQKLEASGVPLPLEYSSPVSSSETSICCDRDEDEEDRSMYQAYLSPDCNNVQLKKDPLYQGSESLPGSSLSRRRKIKVTADVLSSVATDTDTATDTTLTEQMYTARDSSASPGGSDTELDDTFMPEMDSPDELEDSILECLDNVEMTPEAIPELTAAEERSEARHWRTVTVAGDERRIDMKVIEPYKRVLSHGGYLSAGCHNAIIVFSACFLPDKSRVDYDYVMDNLFLYVLTTLDQLITEDYVLIFLHGATRRSVIPTFPWIKRCYQLIDRRLRKTLQGLYIVHPTFWLKTLVVMTKPFISSKFSRKLRFVNSLDELYDLLPLEHASIPDKVKKYDEIKRSMRQGSNLSQTNRV
ncbi:protein prune homolog 2 [Frankliniella occidentalis]|uniref:Protein prune homolog 2 n=1 Tax=Frankliniella occidentalis TaxID=133901 RepID=A0A9C6X1A0_FRAOC|nr:protein prune homolog 2 [Frankliniella occidentalis]